VTPLIYIAIFILVTLVPSVVQAQQSRTPKRVLALYWYNKDFPGNVNFDRSFQARLDSSGIGGVEYYAEYLESNRFPGQVQEQLLRDYLRQKYADRPIDLVVGVSDASMDFLLKYRADLFPRSPIISIAIKEPPADQVAGEPGITGILPSNTHQQTLNLALTLHPTTQQVFVISGTPEHDKRFETVAARELQGYESNVKINYLTDLPLDQLIATTQDLPKNSIILYAWQQSIDDKGELLETWQTLASFAPSASVPIYGMGGVNVGYGLVGGHVNDSETNGDAAGQIAVRMLGGERAQDIPIKTAPAVTMFDWRQLHRWNISENNLPAGSIIRFRQTSFWQRNKWRIAAITTIFLLQTAIIALLLFERRRRQNATHALNDLNAELEERITARTAALDIKSRELETFAYTVAHDLKAPLRGIDGYTRLLLEDHIRDLNPEAQQFLTTIHNSSEEMSQLIDDLLAYSRLERLEFQTVRLELEPLVSTVVEQKTRELNGSNIEFIVDVNGASVVADSNGLAQSLNNYLDNAVKFTSNVPRPCVEIGCDETPEKVKLWVRDNGIGFDMKYHDQIFGIFQRLNSTDDYPGTGIGLAIVRKAMERMGGRAWAESEPGHGATFYLEIPKMSDSLVRE
jgi:signal transduction histidine kinase